MRILQTIIFEYILGYIMQGFTFILGIYAFNRQKIEIKKFLVASVLFIAVSYITRLLPISFGIHTILDLVCLFLIAILFLKMPAFASIKALLIITILLLVTEFLSIFVITNMLGQAQFNNMMNDPINKAIIAIPAEALFTVIIIGFYIFLVCKKKKSEEVGKSST